MTSISAFESLMEEKIGLLLDSVGKVFFEKIVGRRMAECRMSSMDDYLALLRTSPHEMNELIEELTIPETWFFRNRKQLDFLADHIKSNWVDKAKIKGLRILSIPCATGEEPYTIAMILSDLGLSPGRFHIDAVDISDNALKKARKAHYEGVSFRGEDLSFRDRHFETTPEGYSLIPTIRDQVSFIKGNAIDQGFLQDKPPYDIILCRNLFIYLSTASKMKVAHVFQRMLNHDGILLMGHTEECPFEDETMQRIRLPGVFGYKRIDPSVKPVKPETVKHHPADKPVPMVKTTVSKPVSVPVLKEAERIFDPPLTRLVPERPAPRDTGDVIAMFEKAKHLADQGELDSALPLCEEVIKQNSGFVDAYFLKGVICSVRDDNRRAGECFNQVLYLNPDHLDALHHLLILAEQEGDGKKAMRLMDRMKRIRNKMGAD